MHNANETVSAVTTIHSGLRTSGPDAVVFNQAATAIDLIAYAHGQLTILSETLLALEDGSDSALPYALRSVLEPAISAVELAVSRMPSEARHG